MFNQEQITIAQNIWSSITASKNVLLHCHPSPDGDSIGSTLAMYHALKGMGKNVTAIWGDSAPAEQFSFLPGYADIISKNYFEIDPAAFDLFIIQDSGSIDRISTMGDIIFPPSMKTVNIDHHVSNTRFAHINLIPDNVPATCAVLHELFNLWNIVITKEIAIALMMGIYTDTGGFRFRGVTPRIFEMMATLVAVEPRYPDYIAQFDNDIPIERVRFLGIAYNAIEVWYDGRVALSSVDYEILMKHGIDAEHTQKQPIPNMLKAIKGAVIGIECVETAPGKVKCSFRSRDGDQYDVSKVAVALGGGGHKSAAGALIQGTLDEAKAKVKEALRGLFV